MLLTVFENAFLLRSIGWAIANSFWQGGLLWLLYRSIVASESNLASVVKYHLGISLLLISFAWFIVTAAGNYRLLTNADSLQEIYLAQGWMMDLALLNRSLPYLSIGYLSLLCLYGGRFLTHLYRNCSLQRTGLSKTPIDVRLFSEKTALLLGIRRKIRVWVSNRVDVPSVTGFFKPIILLPAAIINHLSIQQTEAVILHELAHIKRNDYLVNLLQSVMELILYFNPFVILLGRAVRKEREHCCDDWVMNFRYDHREYARALLILEEQRRLVRPRFAMAATNGRKELLVRVKRLFNSSPQTGFEGLQKLKLGLFCLLLLAIGISLLPYMWREPRVLPALPAKKESLAVKKDLPSRENGPKIIYASEPRKARPGKRDRKPGRTAPKQQNAPELYYLNAYINDELLKPPVTADPVISQVVEKELVNSKVMVKIVEQQSGKKQTNTYFFELNNKNGTPAIKPLMMLNMTREPVRQIVPSILPDSLDTSTRPNHKKKVTS